MNRYGKPVTVVLGRRDIRIRMRLGILFRRIDRLGGYDRQVFTLGRLHEMTSARIGYVRLCRTRERILASPLIEETIGQCIPRTGGQGTEVPVHHGGTLAHQGLAGRRRIVPIAYPDMPAPDNRTVLISGDYGITVLQGTRRIKENIFLIRTHVRNDAADRLAARRVVRLPKYFDTGDSGEELLLRRPGQRELVGAGLGNDVTVSRTARRKKVSVTDGRQFLGIVHSVDGSESAAFELYVRVARTREKSRSAGILEGKLETLLEHARSENKVIVLVLLE